MKNHGRGGNSLTLDWRKKGKGINNAEPTPRNGINGRGVSFFSGEEGKRPKATMSRSVTEKLGGGIIPNTSLKGNNSHIGERMRVVDILPVRQGCPSSGIGGPKTSG